MITFNAVYLKVYTIQPDLCHSDLFYQRETLGGGGGPGPGLVVRYKPGV